MCWMRKKCTSESNNTIAQSPCHWSRSRPAWVECRGTRCMWLCWEAEFKCTFVGFLPTTLWPTTIIDWGQCMFLETGTITFERLLQPKLEMTSLSESNRALESLFSHQETNTHVMSFNSDFSLLRALETKLKWLGSRQKWNGLSYKKRMIGSAWKWQRNWMIST